MTEVARRFATQSSIPLVIDTTEPPVVEAALQWIGGRPVLNSVNLEDGDAPGTRLDRFLSLARDYGAAVICTCIDTEGQARTADWKLRAAKAIHDLAVERYGLEPSDLLFDPLALPLSTGMEESRRDGIETIEAIRRIKAGAARASTRCSASRTSRSGSRPAARQLLNSVFLHECVQAGLDAAIVHAGKIQPLHRIADADREHLPRPHLRPARARATTRSRRSSRPSRARARRRTRRSRTASGWTVERRLEQRIVDGDRNGLERRARRGPRGRAPGPRHRERHAAGRDAHRRRAVRLRPDAAAVRAQLGRDDEGRRRPSRAAHGDAPSPAAGAGSCSGP